MKEFGRCSNRPFLSYLHKGTLVYCLFQETPTARPNLGDNTPFPILQGWIHCRSWNHAQRSKSENPETLGICMVQRAFNTDSMVHTGFTIPSNGGHFESIRVATLVLRVNYRDASKLCTHGFLSILSWYAEKQSLSSANWSSGERSSDIMTSSS